MTRWCLLLLCCLATGAPGASADDALTPSVADTPWSAQFEAEVDHRLQLPPPEQARYLQMLQERLTADGLVGLPAQAFVVVDRNPQVQMAFVALHLAMGQWIWVGATAVSTGKLGTFEHFLTPLGVFAHSLDNQDFRSEGTYNSNHIRGYGRRGMRVFDFGWQTAQRGWGKGGTSLMRLQMHATDPDLLEPRLGSVASEGCVRIAASFNRFLDRYGILDADYEEPDAPAKVLWVLSPGRQTISAPGRYLVILDSQATVRPAWAALTPSSR